MGVNVCLSCHLTRCSFTVGLNVSLVYSALSSSEPVGHSPGRCSCGPLPGGFGANEDTDFCLGSYHHGDHESSIVCSREHHTHVSASHEHAHHMYMHTCTQLLTCMYSRGHMYSAGFWLDIAPQKLICTLSIGEIVAHPA